MRLLALSSALLLTFTAPPAPAAQQPGPGAYRVDWEQAGFDGPMYLVQCTGSCPGDGLALVGNPGAFPAGSLRVLGGPYRSGAELMQDRKRLLAAGLPARPLRVDVRDGRGEQLDGVVLASPAELSRMTESLTGQQSGRMSPSAPAAPPALVQGEPSLPVSTPGVPAVPADTRFQGQDSVLEAELADLEDRINIASTALSRAGAGDILVPFANRSIEAVTREQLANVVTRQVLGDVSENVAVDENDRFVLEPAHQMAVEARVRDILRQSRELAVGLLRDRAEWTARRDALRAELDRRARGSAERVAARIAGEQTCGFPHRWQVSMRSGGALLEVDAAGNLIGSGLRGGGALSGNRLTLTWSTQASGGVWRGRFLVTLDASCNGAGELVLDERPQGAAEFGLNGGPVTFTSRGADGPS